MGCGSSAPIKKTEEKMEVEELTLLEDRKKSGEEMGEERSLPQSDRNNQISDKDTVMAAFPDERPPMTDEEKGIVNSSWNSIRSDIGKIGVHAFVSLFNQYPFTQSLFSNFRGLSMSELQLSSRLQEHSLKVLLTMEVAIQTLQDPEKLVDILHQLGTSHIHRNVNSRTMDLIGDVIINAMMSVTEEWPEDVDAAWKAFFAHITHIIKEAMPLGPPLPMQISAASDHTMPPEATPRGSKGSL